MIFCLSLICASLFAFTARVSAATFNCVVRRDVDIPYQFEYFKTRMLANANLGNDLTIMAKNGRVVIIGSRGPVEINPCDAMSRNASILGMLLMTASEREIFSIHAAINAGLENDTLWPVVGKELKLAEAPRAHRFLMESSAYGKTVLIP